MFDLRSVRHFLAVAQHRSFVRAAAEEHLTQPALSKSIRALENDLGVRLFERTRNGALLTPTGEIMLKHAKLIVAETKHAVEAISAARQGLYSQIIVGCAPTITETLIPNVTRKFLKRFPGAKLQIHTGLNDELISGLRRGDVDVVFGALPHPESEEFVTEVLYIDPVSVVARSGHPLARKPTVKLSDLSKYPWVMLGPRVHGRDRFNATFVNAGLPIPTVQIESNSAPYNRALVASSDFLSYLPYDVVADAKRIVPLRVKGVTWDRAIGVTFRRRGSLSLAAQSLIEDMRAVLGSMGRLQIREAVR
jgi:DNA-binding transcriptional LysR family regulator